MYNQNVKWQKKEREIMIKFGTGGWRAIIGDEFIKSNVVSLAQAIADDMKGDEGGIVIGYDRRFLSDIASKWAAEVFAANGITVHFINKIAPTPLVMFTVKQMNTKYGMAVTASHNPAEYNGIKVFIRGGRDADVSITRTFEERIEKGVEVKSIDFEEGVKQGVIKLIDPRNEFLDSIIDMINMDAIKNAHLKILLDPMYGVSRQHAARLTSSTTDTTHSLAESFLRLLHQHSQDFVSSLLKKAMISASEQMVMLTVSA